MLRTRMEAESGRIDRMESVVTQIRDVLIKRPSWGISIVITFLCTLTVSLLVLLLKR